MQAISSSYRDNSGFVFKENDIFFRAVNSNYIPVYEKLMTSGLYDKLQEKNLFIAHEEIDVNNSGLAKILIPTQLPFISYAYEWSFSMLKDAAICTLRNALYAFEHGMVLKDANTHNIQFLNGKPILIDSLSFENYVEGESWIAYRQFCECFLAPLLLMKYTSSSMNKLMLAYPNGIPLSVCKSLLPWKAKINMNVYLHVVLATKIITKLEVESNKKTTHFSKLKFKNLLKGLYDFVSSLSLPISKTTWDDYYAETILSKTYLEEKKKLVYQFLNEIEFKSLVDLGANDGEFSLHFANTDKKIIAIDEDVNCIERLYNLCKEKKITNVHPLINDLTTPTPAIGWNNDERENISSRIHADVTLALALIHHLAIANNVPLPKILSYFHSLSPYLVIEFVAKEDAKVKALLRHRKDIFDDYTLADFKNYVKPLFEILNEQKVGNEERWLFLLKRK